MFSSLHLSGLSCRRATCMEATSTKARRRRRKRGKRAGTQVKLRWLWKQGFAFNPVLLSEATATVGSLRHGPLPLLAPDSPASGLCSQTWSRPAGRQLPIRGNAALPGWTQSRLRCLRLCPGLLLRLLLLGP
ncbi:hypothetical protein AAFF_G00320150 [Aldrovandia affinis]|uniref:Uncharacterized protein n=1 Tax=Aldrovandia affinis TaxID=143900 RepID=A0AAD7W0S6_9TELE|nr:hypothetical protein AAFF_G00320150 [Aldrovandia affinis]